MRLLGLFFMLAALFITLATSSPLSELSVAVADTKRGLVDTVGVTVNYPFASYRYDFPNSQCQAPPPQFAEITGLDFTRSWQFCWFFKTPNGCPKIETPVAVGPGDDLHSKVNFNPAAMFCFDPTFKCRGGGECH